MILIHCFTNRLSDKGNPRDYPYWKELVKLIDEPIVQIGLEGDEQIVSDFRKGLELEEIEQLVKDCRIWIDIDSFLQHLGWYLGKPGIVLFGTSWPELCGHKENINLSKGDKYKRKNRFGHWANEPFTPEAFVSPEEVVKHLK